MRPPKDKRSNPPGGRAAERLRDFLEKRLPAEEAEAELEDRTNIKPKQQKENEQRETDSKGERNA
jgi:hypothetical protein